MSEQTKLVAELIRRASEGCEGPLDEPCYRSLTVMHLWCDPCRCQEAAKAIQASAVQGGDAAATVSIDVIRQRALDFAEGYRFGHEDGIEGNAEDADTEELASYQARNEQRCEGRYQVPQTSPPRSEGFDVTYRCALPNGHSGPHGAASAPSAPTPEPGQER